MLTQHFGFRSLLAVTSACLGFGCTPAQPPTSKAAARVAITAKPLAPAPPLPSVADTTHVLMINGGGNPQLNYRSHLLHLEHLRGLLLRAGIKPDRISILASDGSDPAPDLATRETQPEADFWRLKGTRLEHRLQTKTTLTNSVLPGATLEPATKARLSDWFVTAAPRLKSGDTLLLYVTDHGTRNGHDPLNNRILLWGTEEFISVRELRELLAKLDPGVRVVSLMSQCYSGGFAGLATPVNAEEEPSGTVCGYFSSTAERKAYGCFTENLGKDNVGHSFEFFHALEQSGEFSTAHEAVLTLDTTPDVPLRTSDSYLESKLSKAATAKGVTLDVFADQLLKDAFADASEWQAEARLLDSIAQAYGHFSPRSLAELNDLKTRLPEIDQQLSMVSRAWREALSDANASNLNRFIVQNSEWQSRLTDPALAQLDTAGARSLTAEVLPALAQFVARDPNAAARLSALQSRGEAAEDASYRMQVRLAVVLRLRALLLSMAGRFYLQVSGTPQEQQAFAALSECEQFSLPISKQPAPPAAESAPPAYPAFEQDVALTRSALPGWIGISFKDPDPELQKKHRLPVGASLVQAVYPNSPAKAAGFLTGDIVLGPPASPFTSRNQIRAWTMLAPVGASGELAVLRDGKNLQINITPAPFPMKWPSLPGPISVGGAAPKVNITPYKGAALANVRKNTPHLLFFWATWCGPCKAAVPELLAFEKERKVPVVAVTEENTKVLDNFFKKFSAPFPKAVGVDEKRRSFVAYGVSGTPAFIWVDAKGNVVWHQVGYNPRQGLSAPGWVWSGRPATNKPAANNTASPHSAGPHNPGPQ